MTNNPNDRYAKGNSASNISQPRGEVIDVRISESQGIVVSPDKTMNKALAEPSGKASKETIPVISKTLAELFGDVLCKTFKKCESGEGMYSEASFESGGIKQVFLFIVKEKDNYPVKVIPLLPYGEALFGKQLRHLLLPFSKKISACEVMKDKDNPGEVFLYTSGIEEIFKKHRNDKVWSEEDVKLFIDEVNNWTKRTTHLRREAISRSLTAQKKAGESKTKRFSYSEENCKSCKRIVISDRAYTSIIAEAISRDPLETGGILLGHQENGTWYVVEASDPGFSAFHNTVHHEMQSNYVNHIFPVISRLYKHPLTLLGFWHRHPGSFNSFSHDDDCSNERYAKEIGNGTLSFILNFVPEAKLTCYYLDYNDTGSYFKPSVYIGDKYFKGTEFQLLADEKTIASRTKHKKGNFRNAV